jgi:hypothetical protein
MRAFGSTGVRKAEVSERGDERFEHSTGIDHKDNHERGEAKNASIKPPINNHIRKSIVRNLHVVEDVVRVDRLRSVRN